MKFGPKEIKELNEYLRTGRNRKREFLGGGITFASDLTQPEPKKEIVEIDAINAFMKRNPRADGGRIPAKRGVFATGDRRMYAGRMMTEEQIKNLKQKRKTYPSYSGPKEFPKKEGMVYDRKTKEFRPKKEVRLTPGMSEKSAEAKAAKTSQKLKNFVTEFIEKNKRPPTIMEVADGTKSSTVSVKKYLTEGTDFLKTSQTDVGVKGAKQSALARANPEGPDASQKKRYATIKESLKFASKQDKADIKSINDGKKAINKFFKNNPEFINTTEFGKNIKAMMSLRMDKDTGNIFSKLRPDEYYLKKAKEGKLFDIFDIKPVVKGGRSLRFPTNINITPGQFNQVFLQNQAGKLFARGVNKDALQNLNKLLVDQNIRVQLPNVGMIGAKPQVAATGTKSRTFPTIVETLKRMEAPENILKNFIDLAPLPGPLGKIKKLFADGGRIGFESGTIPGGYTDDAYAYLREIDDEIFNAYKKYKAGGGRLKYGPYAYNAKRAMFGAFGIGVPKAYQRKAEGGIIGDKSGPPPERGPLPQGLPGLLKRGMKI